MKKFLSLLILKYFRFFAKLQLQKNDKATIVGITGSAGKTSTKLAIVKILQSRGRVKSTEGANSESGIPLDILGLHPTNYSIFDWLRLIFAAPIQLLILNEHYDYYVVEMGIDSPNTPKNMTYLLSIIKPNIGVVLNAGIAHSANFDYLIRDKNPLRRRQKLIKLISKEKMKLVKDLSSQSVAIVNIDQKELQQELKEVLSRKITYGKSQKADLQIINSQINQLGFGFTFKYQGILYKLFVKDILPDHYAYTFASAIATACALGIPPSLSLKQLSEYRAPAGRMRVFEGINKSLLLDSTYNASPATVLESLKLLKKVGGRHKKIAVLGDMNELGNSSKSIHQNLASQIQLYCDEVLLYGKEVKEYTLPILQLKKFPVKHFDHMSDLIIHLKKSLKPKNYLLFKGSQNRIFLERAVESVLAHSSDQNNLCRRGDYWDRIRAKVA